MQLTDLFIRRPVLAIVVNLVILIAGIQSIRSLSVRQYPRTDTALITVTTAYIGANADLVRGFITTPLEKAIASMDGIDYLESASAQGVSTITVHLKLNYDTNAALTQIQAKVAQVRNDLPPESESRSSSSRPRTCSSRPCTSGSADVLDQSQITDYLTRVVQPKLTAVQACSADILGGRTLPCASGSSPTRWPRPASRRRRCATPWRRTTTCRRRPDQGLDGVGQPGRQHEPQDRRRVQADGDQVGQGLGRGSATSPTSFSARNYEQDSAQRPVRDVHGHLVLPNANSLDVIHRVREQIPEIRRSCPPA
jgi:multidrug efflux pump